MKRMFAVILTAVLSAMLALPAFADVALNPGELLAYEFRTSIIPWIVIAVILVAAALLVWFLVRKHRK